MEHKTSKQSRQVDIFRSLAILEAMGWFFLLFAMYEKHIAHHEEYILPAGMIHGVLFVFFCLCCFLTAHRQGWKAKTLSYGIISAIIPAGTIVFDRVALHKGYFDQPSGHNESA